MTRERLPEWPGNPVDERGYIDLLHKDKVIAYWEARAREMAEALDLIAGTHGTEVGNPRGWAALTLKAIGPLPPEQP